MPRFLYSARPMDESPVTPFASAEEAWFWYLRCQRIRRDGARLGNGSGGLRRPCEPDDIYRALLALRRAGALTAIHVHALGRFGALDRPPDARVEDEKVFVAPWDEALERLTAPLERKGIVA